MYDGKWTKMTKILAIAFLFVIVYLTTNLVVPSVFRDEMIPLADSMLWIAVIGTSLRISNNRTNIHRLNSSYVQLALAFAFFDIFLRVFVGFFLGFGGNMNNWTTLSDDIYLAHILLPLVAREVSRVLLVKTNKRINSSLLSVSLFLTLTSFSITEYVQMTSSVATCEFLIRIFIPAFAINLAASIFAFTGGFRANMAYVGIPAIFTLFCPLLPNVPWQTQSILTVTVAAASLIAQDRMLKRFSARYHNRSLVRKINHWPRLTVIALLGSVAVWSSTGMLGFSPMVIAGKSMEPSLKLGDIAISVQTPVDTIKIGDVIQYEASDIMVIHRVTDAYTVSGLKWFITKGDANDVQDSSVNELQIIGKVIFVIPQLGLVTIMLEDTFTMIIQQISTNFWSWFISYGVYIAPILTVSTYSYLLIQHRKMKKLKQL
jgi:signal peptidase